MNFFHHLDDKNKDTSPTDATTAEIIYLLKAPTVKEFADFMGISQSNATYKLSSVIRNGFVEKLPSNDKRETKLAVTDKFHECYGAQSDFITEMMKNIREKFDDEEIEAMESFIKRLTDEALSPNI